MSFLIDTNVCIAIMRSSRCAEAARYREAEIAGDPIFISVVVLFELEYGIARSTYQAKNRTRLNDFLSLSPTILSLTPEDVAKAGSIRATLERSKQPIGPYDTLIADKLLRGT